MRIVRFILLILLAIGVYEGWKWMQQPTTNSNTLVLFGNVDVREVDLSFRVQGRIDSMPFQEGDLVPAGALVATLDPQPYVDQIKQAEAEIAVSKSQLANAKVLFKRREDLMRDGSVSKEEYDNALSRQEVESANLEKAVATLGVMQTNLDDTKIYAPVEGFLLTRIREPGSVVRPGDPVCTLSIRSPVWVRAYVSEPQLGLIHYGMPAEVKSDVPNGKTFKGQIGFISPVATFTPKTVETPDLRTQLIYTIRIIVDDEENALRQGMPVTVFMKPNPASTSVPTANTSSVKDSVAEP